VRVNEYSYQSLARVWLLWHITVFYKKINFIQTFIAHILGVVGYRTVLGWVLDIGAPM
jgi:hypothetical protein